MKKRIASFLLTLVMLVSLVPTAAISASAASYTVSEAAITVLKKMTSLKTTCYQVADTSEFRIGYGTVCSVGKHNIKRKGKDITITFYDAKGKKTGEKLIAEDGTVTYKDEDGEVTQTHCEHKISERQADALLREALGELDKKVDSFASSNSVNLNQAKHDALVVFSYGVGTAWMSGTNAVKTAIVSGARSADLLNAMVKVYGGEARRKVEVNMYCNGIYSNVVPSAYNTVKYDANGGVVAGGKTYEMYMDSSAALGHPVVPTRNGFKFMGWYLEEEDGTSTFMPKLTSACKGKTLTAHWQENSSTPDEAIAVDIEVEASDLVSRTIYNSPSKQDPKKTKKGAIVSLGSNDTVSIDRQFVDSKGITWGRIASDEELWVILANPEGVEAIYSIEKSKLVSRSVYATPDKKDPKMVENDKGKLVAMTLDNDSRYKDLKKISIDRELIDSKGVKWGRMAGEEDQWVILSNNAGITVEAGANAIAKATVTASGGYVNVRSGAGTNYPLVGSVSTGQTLDILEMKTVNGHKWGRITSGWFCLTYASVTMLGNNTDVDVSSEGALAYTYNAHMTGKPEGVYVNPTTNSNEIEEKYVDDLVDGKDVTVTNMTKAGGALWVKISWKATYTEVVDKKKNKTVERETTAYGWIQITDDDSDTNDALSISSEPVQIGPVTYTVAADELTVREAPTSGSGAQFRMNRGVQFQVKTIRLIGEDIWGETVELEIVNDKYQGQDLSDTDQSKPNGYKSGWVNLSSKYVSRTSLPTVAGGNNLSPIGKTATIVNTDSVRVRICAGLYGRQLGTLSRGTTANILEIEDGWYNLDIDVDNDPETGSWVFEDYVQVNDGYVASNNGSNTTTVNNPDGTKTTTTTVGKGVVANTYSGVNVRSGAGIGYNFLGKLLPGTVVDILETKNAGAAKWGRTEKGWVCMDYITMISSTTTTTTTTTGNGTPVKDFGTIDKTTTTAVYTGFLHDVFGADQEILRPKAVADGEMGKFVWATPKHNQDPAYAVRPLTDNSAVTIYELLEVTEVVWINDATGDIIDDAEDDFDYQENIGDHNTSDEGSFSKETKVSYWARTSDGYIYNPQACITLDPLDEKVHTLTGSDTLNVRDDANGNEIGKLEKGDQVKVTALKIKNDKVWGKIDYERDGIGEGWVRLDYMSEGAYYEEKVTETQTNTTNNGGTAGNNGNIGNTGNTGGFTTNAGGYRYTGKVINTDEVKIRQTASTSSAIVTKLKNGASLVIYETTISENMAWGRCDAGWVYLYYVDLTPATDGLVDARVVYNDNTTIYSDVNGSSTVGTYARMSVIDIYEIVGKMARTDQGWVNTDNLL